MTVLEICAWIEQTPFATAIRESAILFPWIESVHVVAVALVFGFIAVLDLRLLGLASKSVSINRLNDDVLPWVWGAFGFALVTGVLLFSSLATRYYGNLYFRMKMVLLLCAAANMLFFHFVTYRSVSNWHAAERPPLPARVAGGVSLCIWLVIVAFGRYIGFTL